MATFKYAKDVRYPRCSGLLKGSSSVYFGPTPCREEKIFVPVEKGYYGFRKL